ncbi:MAG: 3-dehydroquinate synthase [Candidatus Borkfalkiaceae bacterium]|nr:3-dehydroquinate synthase [Clostridia bacterium]MDY6223403.1 3-dehydroquinate synthase [Christensenellaceae bacterium]
MILRVKTKTGEYEVTVRRGALCANDAFKIPRGGKTLIVTDDGVPESYVKTVSAHFDLPVPVVLPQGERSKNTDNYLLLLRTMTERGFTRHDRAVAVGGGVVGDLCGFAAATYMRGIAFYNVPTTFLSQVDSSIGGKTAIDFCGVKNIVGAFYPPAAVIIDPDVLKTLSARQLHAGVAESIKMSVTSDKELFSLLEESALSPEIFDKNAEEIIVKSLRVKQAVVESDPEEKGLRKVLNFGHTAGHAIESEYDGKLLHGECVALGMLPFASPKIRSRLSALLSRYNLPVRVSFSPEKMAALISHDKKAEGSDDTIFTVYAEDIGKFSFRKASVSEIVRACKEVL